MRRQRRGRARPGARAPRSVMSRGPPLSFPEVRHERTNHALPRRLLGDELDPSPAASAASAVDGPMQTSSVRSDGESCRRERPGRGSAREHIASAARLGEPRRGRLDHDRPVRVDDVHGRASRASSSASDGSAISDCGRRTRAPASGSEPPRSLRREAIGDERRLHSSRDRPAAAGPTAATRARSSRASHEPPPTAFALVKTIQSLVAVLDQERMLVVLERPRSRSAARPALAPSCSSASTRRRRARGRVTTIRLPASGAVQPRSASRIASRAA